MAHKKVSGENVIVCLERIKDLIKDLPGEIFQADDKLAKKKKMADAAIEPLEIFLNQLTEILRGGLGEDIGEDSGIDLITSSSVGLCDRQPTIDPPSS